ncbi:hypothetical protein OsJ_18170 [Oryza sativa Japonica Group]|uniref:Uncharacterized protein n=1 Tax=Oryza sativa subsp. japonica TaxID=39947 RepID=B9FP17_ORYSJ|nr:hypothetical protein OsJ_18170 [Oryza sativa Japonica Group]
MATADGGGDSSWRLRWPTMAAGDGGSSRRRQWLVMATADNGGGSSSWRLRPAGDGHCLRRQWQMAVGGGTVVTMAAAGGSTVVATMPESTQITPNHAEINSNHPKPTDLDNARKERRRRLLRSPWRPVPHGFAAPRGPAALLEVPLGKVAAVEACPARAFPLLLRQRPRFRLAAAATMRQQLDFDFATGRNVESGPPHRLCQVDAELCRHAEGQRRAPLRQPGTPPTAEAAADHADR